MVRRMVLASVLLVAVVGCSSDSDADPPSTTGAASTEPATSAVAGDDHGGLSGEVDITDIVLTTTSRDCADYDAELSAEATDLTRQLMFEAGVTITAGDDSCVLASNNIPNHDFDDESADFANDVAEVAREFAIVRDPQRSAEPEPLTQTAYDGVLLNGVPIDLLSAGCYRPDDPMADEQGIVPIGCREDAAWLANPLGTEDRFGADEHNAHTQPDGGYHYHGNPHALFDDDPGPEGSPVIGFAADGFPIYGSYIRDPDTGEVREAVSGYALKEGARPAGADNPPGDYDGTYYDDYEFTGEGDLDECNGMEVDGQYGYYVTDAFPYLMFCLAGPADPSFDKGAP